MTNKEKILMLRSFLVSKKCFDHYKREYSNLVFKHDQMYLASWETDYHTGDRDDYRETVATDSDYSDYILYNLESDYVSYVEKLELIEARKNRLHNFYNDPF